MSTCPACRVCGTTSQSFFKHRREYFVCPSCDFIFTDTVLNKDLQVMHYTRQWKNQDEAYAKETAEALLRLIRLSHEPRRILDFGAGPGNLGRELGRRGYDVTLLEPMINGYLKDQSYPAPFDAIIAVEVIEHLLNLQEELTEIFKHLEVGGVFVGTTLLYDFMSKAEPVNYFQRYWYKDDPTHVNFFSPKSIETLGQLWNCDVRVIGENGFILKKRG